MNIILCGFMGSGKTVVGKELAKIMGRRFVDTDELVESRSGIAVKAIFEIHGEDYFRELEYKACCEAADMKNCIISTGGGALTYQRNADVLKKSGKIVFLDASFNVICKRIKNSNTRPLFRNREKAEVLYNQRKSIYKNVCDITISGDMSARKTALDIASMFK